MQRNFFKLNIFELMLLSLMFDAYCLFYIQTYPVTIFTLVSIIFVIKTLFHHFSIGQIKLTKHNLLLMLFIVYIILNYFFFGLAYFTAFVQILYFLILCLLAYRKEKESNFDQYCIFFQKIMTVMAIYGIYQFIGRIYGLPFTDIIIPGHMVEGYNWTNVVYIFGMSVFRSNALFREPSFFAQMLSFSILLYIPILLKTKWKKKVLVPLFLQIIAFLLTFSGTGIFMLVLTALLYVTITNKNKKMWHRILLYGGITFVVAIYLYCFTSMGNFMSTRVNELFVYSADASSGFVRFRSWIEVVRDSWSKNILIGSGIGSGNEYVASYSSLYYGMSINGFAKLAVELGLIGTIIFSSYLLQFAKKNKENSNYMMIALTLITFIFMQEAITSNIFWAFLIILNCKIMNTQKEKNL